MAQPVVRRQSARTRPRASIIDAADRSMSSSVVRQFETEIRMAGAPAHIVPPHQHTPAAWTAAIT
jgi:hypothetical protein